MYMILRIERAIEFNGIKLPKADWEVTPPSIRALVLVLSERLRQQDERIKQLEERLNQNSQNSSKPPSSDGFGQNSGAQKSGRKHTGKRPSSASPMAALLSLTATVLTVGLPSTSGRLLGASQA
ncbi:MAG: DUF6444 domain-containing protein [Cyanobacteria bacterium J06636_16]